MDQEDVGYTHTHAHTPPPEYYLVIRKKETLPFVTTWMKRGHFAK